MSDFPEADWKYMQKLKPVLLDRLCERINQHTARILEDQSLSAYERYLSVFNQIRSDNVNIARAFDDWRRSTISTRIIEIFHQGLFTEAEIAGFTQRTKELIDFYRPTQKKKT